MGVTGRRTVTPVGTTGLLPLYPQQWTSAPWLLGH
jgi:hypothetical protein